MSKPWSVSLGKYYARNVVGNLFDGLKVTRYSLYVANTNDSLDLDILTPASGDLLMTKGFGAAIHLHRSLKTGRFPGRAVNLLGRQRDGPEERARECLNLSHHGINDIDRSAGLKGKNLVKDICKL